MPKTRQGMGIYEKHGANCVRRKQNRVFYGYNSNIYYVLRTVQKKCLPGRMKLQTEKISS